MGERLKVPIRGKEQDAVPAFYEAQLQEALQRSFCFLRGDSGLIGQILLPESNITTGDPSPFPA
jgi:hypothetical protein